MSTVEYAYLVGYYNCVRLGKTIDPRLLERGYTEEQISLMKSKMKDSGTTVHSLNIKFSRPLEEFKTPMFGFLLTLYRRYSDGVLPYPGALANQPSKIIEIFNTLESVELEFREKEVAEQQTQAKRAQRKR